MTFTSEADALSPFHLTTHMYISCIKKEIISLRTIKFGGKAAFQMQETEATGSLADFYTNLHQRE